jgi:hypothetical protein
VLSRRLWASWVGFGLEFSCEFLRLQCGVIRWTEYRKKERGSGFKKREVGDVQVKKTAGKETNGEAYIGLECCGGEDRDMLVK